MRRLLLALVTVAVMVGCDCPDAPSTYKGARLSGCSGGGSIQCCSYDGITCTAEGCSGCDYTLCQEDCGDWEEQSWYCAN